MVTLFRAIVLLALVGLALVSVDSTGLAQKKVEFTKEFLNDPSRIKQGKEVWEKRCKFCHGKAAYPGKAPKLEPSRYTPGFVYDRVANGFQAMPPWRQEFSEEELRAVVAYIMSRDFSN